MKRHWLRGEDGAQLFAKIERISDSWFQVSSWANAHGIFEGTNYERCSSEAEALAKLDRQAIQHGLISYKLENVRLV
jgi:hypothetical protein